jgi:hypothetical protein
MRRTVWVRSSRKRAGRGLLSNGRVRVTKPPRKLSAESKCTSAACARKVDFEITGD